MQISKAKILEELNNALDTVAEVSFQLSNTDDTQISYEQWENADNNLDDAKDYISDTINIVKRYMKGE